MLDVCDARHLPFSRRETFQLRQRDPLMITSDTAAPVLVLRDVSKSFGTVRALRSGSLRVDGGSVHALIGENGAGKSTLVKIIAGVHRRDTGTFRFHGDDVDFGSTAESKAAGIAVIYQEPTLFPD